MDGKDKVSLANWRLPPYNRWAFENIRELIPSAVIAAAGKGSGMAEQPSALLDDIALNSNAGASLSSFLNASHSDSMLVMQAGRLIWRWQGEHSNPHKPHILFSMSKSITAMLVGILVEQKQLDTGKAMQHFLPGCKGSAYENCSLQQLLDMQVALEFDESYLQATGAFKRYRDATGWNPVNQLNPGPDLENFLYSLGKSDHEHGEVFAYKSPNSDLLGLLVERVAAQPYAEFMSAQLWQPMGANNDAYVTLDRSRLARGAGGICCCIEDLARIGQLILDKGYANGRQLISEAWIEDTWCGGNREAWVKGDFAAMLPHGRYRNQWYLAGGRGDAAIAIGIHGQWLYIDPASELVIARLSSQPEPLDDAIDTQTLAVFSEISTRLR